jgi:ElaB/YqjD/DUF883 family membrane-anchored ribosome-binding protein
MAIAIKDQAATDAPDIGDVMRDIASLKQDLANLTRSLSREATAQLAPARDALGQFGDDAAKLGGTLNAQGSRAVKAVALQVEERPLTSLLVAFAVGFIGSRLLPR